MDAHSPQDSGSVNRVESVGHIHRDGDLARVCAVAREPLPGNMNDGLTSIWRLDPKLQRLENHTGPLGDQIHGDLASESAESGWVLQVVILHHSKGYHTTAKHSSP